MTDSADTKQQTPYVDPGRRTSSDASFNIAAIALLVLAGAFLLMGVLLLFTTGNAFIGILGGALMAGGCAFLAGWLVVKAVRADLQR